MGCESSESLQQTATKSMLGIFPAIFWLAMASGAISAVMHGRVLRPAREAQRVECSQPSALELPED